MLRRALASTGIVRGRPSPAMIVACIALIAALGGSAYAVTSLPKNSVGTKQLKANAVISSKIKDGTIVGADINKAKLGTVPQAQYAANAGAASSAALAGTAANGARRLDLQLTDNDSVPGSGSPAAHQALALDGLTVAASCIGPNGAERIYVTLTSSVNAEVSYDGAQYNGTTTTLLDGFVLQPPSSATRKLIDITVGFATLQLIYRTGVHTVTVTMVASSNATPGACEVEGTAVAAPA